MPWVFGYASLVWRPPRPYAARRAARLDGWARRFWQASAQDLAELLSEPHAPSAGALLFSCVGRGQLLYGRPNHDSDVFRRTVGAVPLGGFFCNGEVGPVAGKTFLHGYTSAFALFRKRAAQA